MIRRRNNKIIIVVLLTAVLIVFSEEGNSWPVNVTGIEKTFGQPEWGNLLKGIVLTTDSRQLVGENGGRIIFAQTEDNPTAIVCRYPSILALENQSGIREIYRSDSVIFEPRIDNHFSAGAVIAEMTEKNSRSKTDDYKTDLAENAEKKQTIFIQITDDESREVYNPLILFHAAEQQLEQSSIIETKLFDTDSKISVILQRNSQIGAGTYDISTFIVKDSTVDSAAVAPLSPRSISMSIDGRQQFRQRNERIWLQNDYVIGEVGNGRSADELFTEQDRINLGAVTFGIGKHRLLIEIIDSVGREYSFQSDINVTEIVPEVKN